VIDMAVGRDTHVSNNQPDPDADAAAARRLVEALDPSAIDTLLADAKAAGTPIDGADGLLNQNISGGSTVTAVFTRKKPACSAGSFHPTE
jgi:hypothetical protein